jgi:hypothetical protein
MNSLREIVKFVSLDQDHLGSMRGVPNFVPVLSGNERVSMRAMINALLHLPPISLEAEAANTSGQVPLLTTVTVHPSAGVILETTMIVTQNGRVVGGPMTFPNQLEDSSFNAVVPGQYIINVSRVGVPSTGITTMQKNFTINALPHPVTPPPPTPPIIIVTSSGAGQSSVFTIFGSGFLANANVGIRVVRIEQGRIIDVTIEQDMNGQRIKSDGEGKLLGVKIALPCVSGLLFHFSASDGRPLPDAVDHTAVLHSNTVDKPCPG